MKVTTIDNQTAECTIYTVEIDKGYFVDIKALHNTGNIYIMQNEDGSMVYTNEGAFCPSYQFDEPAAIELVKRSSSLQGNGLRITMFKVHEPLEQMIDSMLFASGTSIATMKCQTDEGDIVSLSLEVRGEVRVRFRDNVYTDPTKFPDELKSLIKEHPNDWDSICEDDDDEIIYVSENNWFEYIYDYGDYSDGIVFEEDLSAFTNEQLKEKMFEVCQEIVECDGNI